MSRICIVSCVKSKKKDKKLHKAKDLYTGSLFKKSFNYAQNTCDKTFILSAKHGLISPEKKIETYDVSIGTIPYDEKYLWKKNAVDAIMKNSKENDTIVFLTGHAYKKGVVSHLKKRKVEVPMNRMKIGERLEWLNEQLEAQKVK